MMMLLLMMMRSCGFSACLEERDEGRWRRENLRSEREMWRMREGCGGGGGDGGRVEVVAPPWKVRWLTTTS